MITTEMYKQYLAHLLAGERTGCARIVDTLLDGNTDIRTVYLDLFQESLYEIGRLWETNRISVAREHLATAITEHLLSLIYPRLFLQPRNGRTAVITCVPRELHQVGGKMIADMLETRGWDTLFLGANTPVSHLIEFIDTVKPDLVGLSFSIASNRAALMESIAAIRSHFNHLDLIAGGQGFRGNGTELLREQSVTYIPSLVELDGI